MSAPDTEASRVAEIADFFWAKVDRSNGPDACWPWLGHISSWGYGQYSVYLSPAKHKTYRTHRLAYQLTVGAIQDHLDHLCRNRACCNPAHLEDVASTVNTLRGIGPTSINAHKQTCDSGHPLEGDNLKIVKSKGRPDRRGCRTCRLAATREWKKRRAGERG